MLVGSLQRRAHGPTGLALLWAKAYDRTRAPQFLAAARAAAEHVWRSPVDIGDFCCGSIGEAYALLALARVDPDGDWERRAFDRAALGLGAEPTELGLLHGEAAVLCLATDLLCGHRGTPFVDPVRV